MVSECYLGESRLLHSSRGNKFQQGLKKKRSSQSSKVAQSMWPRARPYVSPDSHPVFRVERNLRHLSCTHPSHRQRHILRILCPHTQVPNIHNICSQGKGNVCLKAGGKKLSICAANVVKTLWRRTEGSILNKYFRSYEISFDSLMPTFRRPLSSSMTAQSKALKIEIFAGIKGVTFTGRKLNETHMSRLYKIRNQKNSLAVLFTSKKHLYLLVE